MTVHRVLSRRGNRLDIIIRRLPPLTMMTTAGALVAGVSAAITFVVLPLMGHFPFRFEDFAAYSSAAHQVAGGASPYSGFSGSLIVMSGFDYPPIAAILLRPLDLLALRWQEILWLWLSLATLIAGAVITARAVLPASWPRARIGIIAVLIFPPATYNLVHGQVNPIIFLLLAIALSDYLGGHRTRCGVVLGIAASIKLAPVILLVVLARRGWWRGVVAGAATIAASGVLSLAAFGWPVIQQYIGTVLPVLNRQNGWIDNQTWNGVISRLFEHAVLAPAAGLMWLQAAGTVLSLATVALLLVAVRRGQRSREERGVEFACGIVVMLLVGSVAWYPVYVSLLIAIAAALGLAHQRGREGHALTQWSIAACLGVSLAGTVFLTGIGSDTIAALSKGPLWWGYLQACSIPALLVVGLLVVMTRALRAPSSARSLRAGGETFHVATGVALRDRAALVP